jgi:hypothetical protein
LGQLFSVLSTFCFFFLLPSFQNISLFRKLIIIYHSTNLHLIFLSLFLVSENLKIQLELRLYLKKLPKKQWLKEKRQNECRAWYLKKVKMTFFSPKDLDDVKKILKVSGLSIIFIYHFFLYFH